MNCKDLVMSLFIDTLICIASHNKSFSCIVPIVPPILPIVANIAGAHAVKICVSPSNGLPSYMRTQIICTFHHTRCTGPTVRLNPS